MIVDTATHAIPKRSAYLKQLAQVLDMQQFERFVLASHSYGSVLSTYILTHEPLARRVASTLLIDPVTILLLMPDVAYDFTARLPKHTKEWQLWFFGSKDPGVAYCDDGLRQRTTLDVVAAAGSVQLS
jgi:pimeloyl-ACP methyl ester carboxylesterase